LRILSYPLVRGDFSLIFGPRRVLSRTLIVLRICISPESCHLLHHYYFTQQRNDCPVFILYLAIVLLQEEIQYQQLVRTTPVALLVIP